MAGTRKVKIVTYGCQMNVYDTEHMLHHLAAIGFEATEIDDEADLIILNTCSVREKAAHKVYSELGRHSRRKKRRPHILLAVAGCVAQQEQERLLARVPALDIVLGPDHVQEIGQLVEARERTGRPVLATRFLAEADEVFSSDAVPRTGRVSAFVTVMKGCNQFCSYCIVPFTRGRETSKPPEKIVAEVETLLAAGVREIFLLGQNVNRYGLDRPGLPDFPGLLRRIHDLPGLARLRFVTSHPADCSDDLVDAFGELPRLTPFFHLPLQSGSDRILAAMNRGYDMAQYRGRVAALRAVRPGIHLSTDLIVGFPGESDADFEATMAVARELRWGSAFSFKYSPRPGTAAVRLGAGVPAEVTQARLEKLQEILYDTMHEALKGYVGRVEEVLVEGRSNRIERDGLEQFTGRTGSNYIVNFTARPGRIPAPGELLPVRITRAFRHSLLGESVEEES